MFKKTDENKSYFTTTVDLTIHLILALVLAAFFYWLTGRWVWPILGIAGGILIDIDHFVDYFNHYGLKFVFSDFYCQNYGVSGKRYVFLHSWEIIILLWLISRWVLWITPIVTGMTIHLLADYIFHQHMHFIYFSLIYRWYHKFEVTEKGA
ncbi:MAG: hypothetical protein HQ594_03405 [Candidatus Omnitrophica bacterium]|nr:hypothetical protein [Candidatus Omnitrophota bacterium]